MTPCWQCLHSACHRSPLSLRCGRSRSVAGALALRIPTPEVGAGAGAGASERLATRAMVITSVTWTMFRVKVTQRYDGMVKSDPGGCSSSSSVSKGKRENRLHGLSDSECEFNVWKTTTNVMIIFIEFDVTISPNKGHHSSTLMSIALVPWLLGSWVFSVNMILEFSGDGAIA